MSRLWAGFAGGGWGAGFLCVAGGGQFLSRSFSSYWALLPLVLWPERVILGGVFCLYPLAFPVAEVFKSEITWGRKKPRELSAVFSWPRGPRSAPSSRLPSRVSGHYCHVGLQGGAVSPFISEQKVPGPSLTYFFLCYSEQVIPTELWGFTDFPLPQPLHC